MAAGNSLLHLTHMLDNIERIRGWTDGMTIEAYQADPMLRDEIIGNVLRYEYHDVADTEVWRIVVDDLGELSEAIKALMQKA